ncbi:hypothetical protein Barb4_04675 [Bacteroidales bacterium Barb4]|nr:hypothetical protein Barb4_04675 [Bacteroidales bacterium Barb4]
MQAATVAFSTSHRSSTVGVMVSPNSRAVPSKSCHIPTAWAWEATRGSRWLSITARYLKSSGMPYSFNTGSMTGK